MAYRILAGESVQAGVRRIACEQIDKVLAELHDDAIDRHETVHQARKRCKKIRGLIRLVRPPLGAAYAPENAYFRDAARTLSAARDATALLETYDALMERFAGQIDRRAFGPIRRALTLRRRHFIDDRVDLDARLAAFREEMQRARQRAAAWSLDAEGFAAVAGGLEKTYRRGHTAMARAYEEPTDANFHEWRKRVKYHWYHTRLLRPVWSPLMKQRSKALSLLSDLLGDDHNLAVFRQTLYGDPGGFGNRRSVQAFLGLLDRRRAELQAQARPLGARLFAEKPAAFGRRIGQYWEAWHAETGMQPALAEPPAVTAA